MPRRWPRPHGMSVSRARTPRPSWWSIRGRLRAPGARASTVTSASAVERRAAVDRPAEAVEDAAAQRVADADPQRAAGVADRVADAQAGGGGRAAGRRGRRVRSRRPRRAPARGRPPRAGRRRRRAGRSPAGAGRAARPRGRSWSGRDGLEGALAENGGQGASSPGPPGAGRSRSRRAGRATCAVGLDDGVGRRPSVGSATTTTPWSARSAAAATAGDVGVQADRARRVRPGSAASTRRTASAPGSSARPARGRPARGSARRRARTAWCVDPGGQLGQGLVESRQRPARARRPRPGARPRGAPRRQRPRCAACSAASRAVSSASRRPWAQPTA